MNVKELLSEKGPAITVKADTTMEVAMKRMIDKHIGSLIITNDMGNPIGIITEHDIFQVAYRCRGDIMDLTVRENMTETVATGTLTDTMEDIARVMIKNCIRHIPVTDESRTVCGVLSIRDILSAMMDDKTPSDERQTMETSSTTA